MPTEDPAPLVKSRQRDHGEVFTPAWMVDAMLDQVRDETERIGSRFLEPACGDGNYLDPVLRRKLAAVEARYGRSEFERSHQALYGLMCVYGIELLEDNAEACRARLHGVFCEFVGSQAGDDWDRVAAAVLSVNIIRGNAMSMLSPDGEPIQFPEWAYLGRGRFLRRDFRLDNLSQRSQVKGTIFDHFEEHEVFAPVREYPPMTVKELAA